VGGGSLLRSSMGWRSKSRPSPGHGLLLFLTGITLASLMLGIEGRTPPEGARGYSPTEEDWDDVDGSIASVRQNNDGETETKAYRTKIYQTTVYWYGGARNASCGNCLNDTARHTFLAPDYACSSQMDTSGQWDGGTKSFRLGINSTQTVTQVNVTAHGRLDCSEMGKPIIINMLVESLSITQSPVEYVPCRNCTYCQACSSCMTNVSIAGIKFAKWPVPWHYDTDNTITVSVYSGAVCLHSVDIFVETRVQSNTSGTTTGGEDRDFGFQLPFWSLVLVGGSALLCILSVVFWVIHVSVERIRKRRRRGYGSIQDPPERNPSCCSCIGYSPDSATETEDEYHYRDPSIYASINSNEMGDDTKKLLGIPANMGGAEKGILKISHKATSAAKHQQRKKSQTDLIKQMDYGEIVLIERVGKGSYGEVFKGSWRGTEVAVKKLPYYFQQLEDKVQQKQFLESFIQETQLMKTLRHPNVIQLYASFSQPEVMIVMEFMSRGSLYHILHDKSIELTWDLKRQLLLDAARGMTYLHKSQPVIVHRDLKSHNLLVDQHWRCKVSDFGLSRIATTLDTMTACGTPSWTAPEVLRGEKYTEKCDVYSFGIVLWETVTRSIPHEGIPHFQVVFQVGTQSMRPEIPPDAPHHWARLTSDCWADDPDSRPSFEDIFDRLQKF